MITSNNGFFKIDTRNTSYIFFVNQRGHLEHVYYGAYIKEQDYTALRLKNTVTVGSSVEYDEKDFYSLDTTLLEYSGIGKGDYRHSPVEIIMPDGSFVCDFVYEDYEIFQGSLKEDAGLPFAYGEGETLTVTLQEKKFGDIKLKLNYTVYSECDTICRNVELVNLSQSNLFIRKLMSLMVDFPGGNYDAVTFDGTWCKEANEHRHPVEYGAIVNDSVTGSSSNRHNAGFLLLGRECNEDYGSAYAFNLIYSGNHYSEIEKATFGTIRVMSGINPHCFMYKVAGGDRFVTPQSVMTYSDKGTNGMSLNMHDFVNHHIVRGKHKNEERPIVLNNWEATDFNFNRRKLLALAGEGKKLGVEMFVLDDGWFGKRNSDRAGLGDWVENKKKIGGSLKSLANKINKIGLKFGLWFEPECVNPDSDLFRLHPDWAISCEGREASLGRHQLVLDLTRSDVRNYIIDSVDKVLTSANIEYVKWDYNRHISDMFSKELKNQGEFYHRYILGLYEILEEIFVKRHPDILFESCSSGGNRFDLGMLCYSPQIWTSDNTDPVERLRIQSGITYLYPQSTVSAHVSMAPHQQTLRDTPLSTRFNVACFGVLGFELDLSELSSIEKKDIREKIEFYKAHRKTFQYGRLRKVKGEKPYQTVWEIEGEGEIMSGFFQSYAPSAPDRDILKVVSAKPEKLYTIKTLKQYLKISRFGGLIKHVTPVKLKSDGFILRTVNKFYQMTDGSESYECYGDILNNGVNLAMQYSATGYNDKIRILGDFGSNIYITTEKEEE